MSLAMPERIALVRGMRMLDRLQVREEPPGSNSGPQIEAIQKATGNKPPDPWCASAVAFVGRIVLERAWPVPLTASCDQILEWSTLKGCLKREPTFGALFLVMRTPDDATHVGVVESVFDDGSWRSIEGNAADPQERATREGIGCFEGRTRGHNGDRTTYLYSYWWEG